MQYFVYLSNLYNPDVKHKSLLRGDAVKGPTDIQYMDFQQCLGVSVSVKDGR